MENATKALLMAGGILIAMLIISIGVFLFANYSDFGSSYDQTLQSTEIQKFNENFTKFERRTDITIQEIVTVANFAKQYEEQTEVHIEVELRGKGDLNDPEKKFIDIIKENDELYRCNNIGYDDEGKVISIEFI